MLELLTFRPAFGQPSGSPFCTKAVCFLNLAGVEWRRADLDDPRKMPHAKLPVVKDGQRLIPDSEGIRAFLEAGGADFDAGLTSKDKAYSRALIRMADEHLYFHLMHDRWANDAVWPHLREVYFAAIPGLLRGPLSGIVRRDVMRQLYGQGSGRLDDEERMARVEADLVALAELVSEGFLFGDRPTAAACSVGPMLAAMTASPVETALASRVRGDATLRAYTTRVAEALYPAGPEEGVRASA